MQRMKVVCQRSLPTGWKVNKDVTLTDGDLELVSFLNDGENWVDGAEMIKRAKKLGGLTGLAYAQYLLAHQEEIPREWRNFVLVFVGCECEDSGGDLRVPYLCFLDGQWRLRFVLLGYYFSDDYRLVRLYK